MILTGNTFWMGYDHNLLIEDCSNIIIGSNNFDRNPRYSYGNSHHHTHHDRYHYSHYHSYGYRHRHTRPDGHTHDNRYTHGYS